MVMMMKMMINVGLRPKPLRTYNPNVPISDALGGTDFGSEHQKETKADLPIICGQHNDRATAR